VSYGIGDAQPARWTGHTHGPRSSVNYAFLWRSEAHEHHANRSTAGEAALGYDHEAVSYGIEETQRTHGQGTLTSGSGHYHAFLWEKPSATCIEARKRRQHWDMITSCELWNGDAQHLHWTHATDAAWQEYAFLWEASARPVLHQAPRRQHQI
jgi:hypothetical protein